MASGFRPPPTTSATQSVGGHMGRIQLKRCPRASSRRPLAPRAECRTTLRGMIVRADAEDPSSSPAATDKTTFVAETLLPTRNGKFRVRAYRHTVSPAFWSRLDSVHPLVPRIHSLGATPRSGGAFPSRAPPTRLSRPPAGAHSTLLPPFSGASGVYATEDPFSSVPLPFGAPQRAPRGAFSLRQGLADGFPSPRPDSILAGARTPFAPAPFPSLARRPAPRPWDLRGRPPGSTRGARLPPASSPARSPAPPSLAPRCRRSTA